MIIDKSNISQEDANLATDILQKLRIGNRVFGSPASGLKKTLKKLEENKPEEDSYESTQYHLKNWDYEEELAKLKKGIEGEKILAEYISKLIRLDEKLKDLIIFASLGEEKEGMDYIPDTDFLCVYGDNYLVLDAKNIKTNLKVALYVSGFELWEDKDSAQEPILTINDPKPYWREQLGEDINIDNCVCIINKTGANIQNNFDWENIKPIHIVDLYEFLLNWVKDKSSDVSLRNLVIIAKDQIKINNSSLDLSAARRELLGNT